ncbi:MAG: hypothetical protein M3M96_01400, partial [Candidatus Eremiobacteraeota bacterium]|nr:hypothetical protein [Candidatus Eremiobacteraeota bacterium]
MSGAYVPRVPIACMCAVLFTFTACGRSGNAPAIVPTLAPSPQPSGSTQALYLRSLSLPGDEGPAQAHVSLAVKDAKGTQITGSYVSPVTVSVTSGTPHVLLSIDGVTKATSVTVRTSTDAANLNAYYDGNGGAGYAAALNASATGASPSPAMVNTITVSGSVVFGSSPAYAAGKASFTAPSQQLKLTASETNFNGAFSV